MNETALFCGHCGQELTGVTSNSHERCRTALVMEPPRYCEQCRRRMVVQVHPTGWSARCSVHGEISSS